MRKSEEIENLELNVQMFGNFQVNNENGTLNMENMRSEMLTRLLAYMLCHRDKALTVQELTEAMWPDVERDNPGNGALKNLMYRLRTLLKKTWGDYEYILSGRGTYQWNPKIVLKVDAEEFEKRCKNIFKESDAEVQIAKGKEAVALYQGNFLAELSTELWVISPATYYNSIHLSTVKKLAALMEQKQRYIELEELCRKELEFEPLDEAIHGYLLRALLAENKHAVAAKHYEKTSKVLYDTLGVGPTEELRKIYEDIQKQKHVYEDDIEAIHEELEETRLPEGALLCEYGVFHKIYELEKRRSSRTADMVHLLLISVSAGLLSGGKNAKNKQALNDAMEELELVLKSSLRSSDVICRYSRRQFLVMLPICSYKNAQSVVGRIKEKFEQKDKTKKIILQCSIDEIEIH